MASFRYQLNQAAAPVVAGVFLGAIEGTCLIPFAGTFFGAIMGLIVSLFLLPFALMCIGRKDPVICMLWLGCAPFLPLMLAVLWTKSLLVPMFIAVVGYLLTLAGFSLFLPNVVEHTTGHCRKCGYDLTGNVSGICPECGTPKPKDAAETA